MALYRSIRSSAATAAISSSPKSFAEIPSLPSFPVLGNMVDFHRRAKGFKIPGGPCLASAYQSHHKEVGPIYKMNLVGERFIVVCKPEEYLKMYRNEGEYPPGGVEALWMWKRWAQERNYTKNLDFQGRGKPWQDVRRALQEDLISPKDARTYLPYFNEACRRGSLHFDTYSSDPSVFSKRIAFDMFCAMLYGQQMGTSSQECRPKDMEFVENTVKLFTVTGNLLFQPYMQFSFLKNHPLNREFTERADRSIDFAIELMDESLQAAKSLTADCKPYLVKAVESGRIPKDTMRQLVPSLLLAGVDTTQSVLSWNLLWLAENPGQQEMLRAELREVLGDGDLTPEIAANLKKKLPYLSAVIRECHRLSPATNIMTQRKAPCDLEMEGYIVPEGTVVSFDIYSVQNDSRYVQEPAAFRPERWFPEAVQARVGTEAEIIDHKLLSNPFSFGARMCLGGRVAHLEILTMLSRVVRDWKFSKAEDSAPWANVQPLMTKAMPFPAFHIEPARRET